MTAVERKPVTLRRVATFLFRYADYEAAALAFGGVLELDHVYHSQVAREATTVLGLVVGIGLAVLAIVLASLAILVAFMGDEYLMVLRTSGGGTGRVVKPYKTLAFTGCCTVIVSLGSLLAWDALPQLGQSVAIAAASGLAVASLVGTVQLVSITARHGDMRARLLENLKTWRSVLQRLREEESTKPLNRK